MKGMLFSALNGLLIALLPMYIWWTTNADHKGSLLYFMAALSVALACYDGWFRALTHRRCIRTFSVVSFVLVAISVVFYGILPISFPDVFPVTFSETLLGLDSVDLWVIPIFVAFLGRPFVTMLFCDKRRL